MNTLDTTNETATKWSPYKAETKKFLEDAKLETVKNVVNAILGSAYVANKMYVLYGCVATGTDPGVRTVTAGAIFYNGEVYSVDAFSGTTTGSDVLVASVSDTADLTADPTTFSDGTQYGIHRVRKIAISIGASGSGAADLNNFIYLTADDVQAIAIGSQAVTDQTGATDYLLATFAAVGIAGKKTIFVSVQHTPSASQGITLNYKIKVNGSTQYTFTWAQGNPLASFQKENSFHKTLTLLAGDVATVTVNGQAAGANVTTINIGEATMKR